jgi:hypothetical protein
MSAIRRERNVRFWALADVRRGGEPDVRPWWKAVIDVRDGDRHLASMKRSGRSWLPSAGAIAGVLATFAVFLLIGFPMMVMILQSGGGCEGHARPCEPDNTALDVGLVALLLLLTGTWWGTRKLVNFFVHGD